MLHNALKVSCGLVHAPSVSLTLRTSSSFCQAARQARQLHRLVMPMQIENEIRAGDHDCVDEPSPAARLYEAAAAMSITTWRRT